MSTTPRTDAELEKRGQVDEYLCRDLELALGIANATISELRKELAEATAARERVPNPNDITRYVAPRDAQEKAP